MSPALPTLLQILAERELSATFFLDADVLAGLRRAGRLSIATVAELAAWLVEEPGRPGTASAYHAFRDIPERRGATHDREHARALAGAAL